MKHKIICGDAISELKKLTADSQDLVITSPPYYGLRNYGVDGQIGLEKSFEEYINKLMDVTAEVKRVLKKYGQFWLNLGDCYGGSGMGMSYAGHTKGPNSILKDDLSYMPAIGHNRGQYDKCLLMQPERIAIRMIDKQGWILRNKIKYAKQILIKKDNYTIGSVMPTSTNDRFNESGEELFFFVKNKKYFSDLDAVRLRIQTFEDRPDGMTRCREYGYDTKLPQFRASEEEIKNYQGKFAGNPDAEMFNSPRARTQRKSLEARMEDTKNKDAKSSPAYNMKKLLSDVRLGIKPNTGMEKVKWDISERQNELIEGGVISSAQRIRGFFDEFGGGNNPLGKNLPTCWLIGSEPHNFQKELDGITTDHFATFPQALLDISIRFGCPESGTVLDPFAGAGTTALVADRLGRNSISIDLNKKYCEIAYLRLKKQMAQTKITGEKSEIERIGF